MDEEDVSWVGTQGWLFIFCYFRSLVYYTFRLYFSPQFCLNSPTFSLFFQIILEKLYAACFTKKRNLKNQPSLKFMIIRSDGFAQMKNST